MCTPEGLFEFSIMPFGLCNTPATFQRLIECVLPGLHWKSCLVYLDDVIIVGRTVQEHLNNMREVFQRLQEAGLKLKPLKCFLFQEEVHFLGHIVSQKGIATNPEAVKNWPTPRNSREVQQFLGLCNYYRRFIQSYASVAKPLYQLTEKNKEFRWTESCEEAFTELKNKLATAPVLAFPYFSKEFILDTDASNVGIDAVLSQVGERGESVVAYASRVLNKPERKYSVTRKELLAVVTFLHHFRPYLLGKKFTVRTDHGSHTWLKNFQNPEGQLARWLE